MWIVSCDPFLMKKLLKSKICESINSAHRALFTGKVKYFGSKKKNKRNAKRAFALPKRTLKLHHKNMLQSYKEYIKHPGLGVKFMKKRWKVIFLFTLDKVMHGEGKLKSNLKFWLWFCVCVCVCVWERERERERFMWGCVRDWVVDVDNLLYGFFFFFELVWILTYTWAKCLNCHMGGTLVFFFFFGGSLLFYFLAHIF